MARQDHWTDAENDLIVADYFEMLADELAKRQYLKAGHNRMLQHKLGRSKGSIEYKHQNISAVLRALGQPWIAGYKPAANFQDTLIDAVVRWLDEHSEFLGSELVESPAAASDRPATLPITHPPTVSNEPPPKWLGKIQGVAKKFDFVDRDQRNRALGRAGEERALAHERATLTAAGRTDLARRVRWVSEDEGDGAGYDIASFSPGGSVRLIEVKTTNGWERTPFYISRNELAVANERPDEWRLLRLYDFVRQPRAFELRPPLTAHVELLATSYEARFR